MRQRNGKYGNKRDMRRKTIEFKWDNHLKAVQHKSFHLLQISVLTLHSFIHPEGTFN